MKDSFQNSLKEIILEKYRNTDIAWGEIEKSADEIVVFGSRSQKVENMNSDVDVLFIGVNSFRMRERIGDVDLISIAPDQVYSDRWLGSELASHVCKYGVWIKGDGGWCEKVSIDDSAVRRKSKYIYSRVNAYLRTREFLHPVLERKQLRKIRRDCERLALLKNRTPIPCNHFIDEMCSLDSDSVSFCEILNFCGVKEKDVDLVSTQWKHRVSNA